MAALMSRSPTSPRFLARALRQCTRLAGTTVVGGLLIGCTPDAPDRTAEKSSTAASQTATTAAPSYAGTLTCIECHAEVGVRWRGSDHDLAMQQATAASVLGDFSASDVVLDGQTWSFEQRDDGFFTRPPDGDVPEPEQRVAYTFGVRPLQQYLVTGAGGRLQPLPVAWDSRPREAGGQRWIHIYQGEGLRVGDPLHWTGRVQTWNHQCAACHSTGLERGYDEASDRYQTRWQELDVGCEACHGPGALHVELARGDDAAGARAAIRGLGHSPGRWTFAAGDPIARRSLPAEHAQREIDTCAPCHSRRSRIAPDSPPGDAFLDGYLPSLLEEGLYFADGRMRDEVYVWGSFQQSRMHAAGVRCSDCHDPHSLEVRTGPDAVCASCHQPADFATSEHHGHAPRSPGASCVACHMPERTYMQVDARRDHSLSIPRPDIAALTGSPSVCAACHEGRDAEWAAAQLAQRGALRDDPHPGVAIAAAWAEEADAGTGLAALIDDTAQPAITRATAASLLGRELDRETLPALRAALADPDALVRLGAVRALEALAPVDRLALGREQLRDPVLAVRIEAARMLVEAPPDAWAPGERVALADALRDYRRSQEINADRVEAQLNLSALETRLGNAAEAIERARRALAFAPNEPVTRVNLADVLRRGGKSGEEEAERVLREGLARQPASAELELALGLSLVRQGRPEQALTEIERSYDHAPDSRRIAYTYAIALQSAGRIDEGIAVLEQAHSRYPRDPELLYALATIERDRGRRAAAARWAEALLALDPTDRHAQSLLSSLERESR